MLGEEPLSLSHPKMYASSVEVGIGFELLQEGSRVMRRAISSYSRDLTVDETEKAAKGTSTVKEMLHKLQHVAICSSDYQPLSQSNQQGSFYQTTISP